MKLFEIDAQIRSLLENIVIDEETGEISGDIESLGQLQIDAQRQLEGIGCYIKELEADIVGIKSVSDDLKKRLDSKTKKRDNLKKYLSNYASGYLVSVGRTSFETDKIKLFFRSAKALEILDEDRAFEDARAKGLIKIKEEINTSAVKEWLAAGNDFAGAVIADRQHLQIK